MSFFFVDRIFSIEDGKKISGIKNVTKSETFVYRNAELGTFLNPAIVCEAVMQLTSWLIIKSSDFKLRPVVLRIDSCEFFELVRCGDQIRLEAEIHSQDEDLYEISGQAFIGDKKILEAKSGQAYALPIDEFDNPKRTLKQFEAIYRPEFENVSRVLKRDTIDISEATETVGECKFFAIDRIQRVHTDKSLKTLKQFSLAEDFFKDHFPRKPVVPAIVQLTAVGESAQILATHLNEKSLLVPKYIRKARLRHFIEPGSECISVVKLISGDLTADGSEICFQGQIECEGKRMMQLEFGFTNHLQKPKATRHD